MNLKLPISIKYNNEILDTCSIKGFTAGLLADTKKSLENENPYKAYMVFLAGCIEEIGNFNEKNDIRNILKTMSYKTAEYLTVKILALDEDDDGIEGIYNCPRCNSKIIAEKINDEDTRDFIKDLKINILKEEENFEIKLKNPIEIKYLQEDDLIQIVESLAFRYPTLTDCINAFNKYGKKNPSRLQFAIYLEALEKVNGQIPFGFEKFKSRFGLQILEDFTKKDLILLGEKVNEYGLNNKVFKICKDCGKEFEVYVNTSNFFVSALR